MEKKLLLSAMLLLSMMGARATETVIWQGSKSFASWSDVLNIEGRLFNQTKADDVLHLSITASAGAQLQLSWGNEWTCFEGLEHKDISGDDEMVLTASDVTRLRQGIHIKGTNFTLTAVTLSSNDGQYTTQAEDLFAWKDMLLSGATQGETCTVGLQAYGGAGWYWPETVDLSGYGSIVVELLQPAAETMTLQLFYGEKGVKSQVIAKGAMQGKLTLSTTHKKAYSLNIISEKAQAVSISSVNLTDRQGNPTPTGVNTPQADSHPIVGTEYYTLAGVRLTHPQAGINMVKQYTAGGRTVVWKEWK